MSTIKHFCMKTDRGGPYIFRSLLNNDQYFPVSLSGPFVMPNVFGDHQFVIDELTKMFVKTELQSFDTWEEMLKWAMKDSYLK